MSITHDQLPVTYGTGEILADSYDWRTTKLKSNAVASVMDHVGRSQRMFDCGSVLDFAVSENNEMRLYKAIFCKDRLCPGCQRRRSIALFNQVRDVCNSIKKDNPTYKYLMLTLTVPNVKADELNSEIKHMMKSWDKLTKRKEFKNKIKGYFRALEVTYNSKRDDYHPHFHILLCVSSNYFGKNYIPQARWLELWQESTKYPHITQVDIRAIRPNKKRDSDSVTSAAAEVAKYSTKPSDYVEKISKDEYKADKKVVNQLVKSLAYKRLVSFGGVMKDHFSKLGLTEVESDEIDLIHVDGEKSSDIEAVMIKVFRWNVGLTNYVG